MGTRRSITWLFTYRLLMLGLSIIQTAVVSRALEPTGRGILYFNMTVAGLLPLFLVVGLPTANTYFLGTGKVSRDTLLSNTFWYGIIAGLLGILLHLGVFAVYRHDVVRSLNLGE